MHKPRKVTQAENRLGIRIQPGRRAAYVEQRGKKEIRHPAEDGFWLFYGHGFGAEWFPTEAAALSKLDDFLTRQQEKLAKDMAACGVILRWAVTTRLEVE